MGQLSRLSGYIEPEARCYRRSPRLAPSLKLHRTQLDAPVLRAPSFCRRCQPAIVRPGPARCALAVLPIRGRTRRDGISCRRDVRFPPNGTGSCEGSYDEQVSLAVLTASAVPSVASAPYRFTRHMAAGNAVSEPSTAWRPIWLPLIGAEPLAGGIGVCSAGPHSRFSATSWNWRVLRRYRRRLLGVRLRNSGPPVFVPLLSSSWRCRAKSLSYRSQARPSFSRSIRR